MAREGWVEESANSYFLYLPGLIRLRGSWGDADGKKFSRLELISKSHRLEAYYEPDTRTLVVDEESRSELCRYTDKITSVPGLPLEGKLRLVSLSLAIGNQSSP